MIIDEMIALNNNEIYEKIKSALPVMAEAYKSDLQTITKEQIDTFIYLLFNKLKSLKGMDHMNLFPMV